MINPCGFGREAAAAMALIATLGLFAMRTPSVYTADAADASNKPTLLHYTERQIKDGKRTETQIRHAVLISGTDDIKLNQDLYYNANGESMSQRFDDHDVLTFTHCNLKKGGWSWISPTDCAVSKLKMTAPTLTNNMPYQAADSNPFDCTKEIEKMKELHEWEDGGVENVGGCPCQLLKVFDFTLKMKQSGYGMMTESIYIYIDKKLSVIRKETSTYLSGAVIERRLVDVDKDWTPLTDPKTCVTKDTVTKKYEEPKKAE